MIRKILLSLFVFSFLTSNVSPVSAKSKPRYAKTEADKAIGKCVGAVVGGALLGALVGGKKNRFGGAAVGAAAGGAVCAILMKTAKKKDRIIAAQRETALRNTDYVTSFADDDGGVMQFSGRVGTVAEIDGDSLMPVKYAAVGGGDVISPVLETGGHECRTIDSSLTSGSDGISLPSQYYCRTPAGDWEPYSAVKV